MITVPLAQNVDAAHARNVLRFSGWASVILATLLVVSCFWPIAPWSFLGFHALIGVVWCSVVFLGWARRNSDLRFLALICLVAGQQLSRGLIESHQYPYSAMCQGGLVCLLSGVGLFYLFRSQIIKYARLDSTTN